MKKIINRLMSFLLTIALLFSLCQFGFAETNNTALQPYARLNCSVKSESVTIGGKVCANGIEFSMGYNGLSTGYTAEAVYNLSGNYSSISFDIGYISGANRNANFELIADGVILSSYSVEIKYDASVKHITVPISGYKQFIIKFTSNGYDKVRYGIGNITFFGTAKQTKTAVSDEFYYIPCTDSKCVDRVTEKFQMCGKEYENGYVFRNGYHGAYDTILNFDFNKQYKKLSFDLCRYLSDGSITYTRSAYLTITVDDVVISNYDSKELVWSDLTLHVDVNLNGASKVSIKLSCSGYDMVYYRMGDIQLVSDGKAHGIEISSDNIKLTSSYPKVALLPKVYPSDAADKSYTVSHTNSSVMLYNDNFTLLSNDTRYIGTDLYVHGRYQGTDTITFKTNDGGITKECFVTSTLSAAKYLPSINGWGFENLAQAFDSDYTFSCSRISSTMALDRCPDGIRAITSAPSFLWYNFFTCLSSNGGICHGLSMSSVLTYTGDLSVSDWSNGKFSKAYDIKTFTNTSNMYSSELDLTLKQLIMCLHLSQVTTTGIFSFKTDGLFNAVKNFRNYGTPVVLNLKKSGGSHSVIPSDLIKMSDDTYYMYIYDSNEAKVDQMKFDETYLSIKVDGDGNILSWTYPSDTRFSSKTTELRYISGIDITRYYSQLKNNKPYDFHEIFVTTSSEIFDFVSENSTLLSYGNGNFSGGSSKASPFMDTYIGYNTSSPASSKMSSFGFSTDTGTLILGGSGSNVTTGYYSANCGIIIDCPAGSNISKTGKGDVLQITAPDLSGNIQVQINLADHSVFVSGKGSISVTVPANGEPAISSNSMLITEQYKNGSYSDLCLIDSNTNIIIENVAHLPQNTTTIQSKAFDGTAFNAIIIPASCISIAKDAFTGCKNLKYIINESKVSIPAISGVTIIS